MGGTEVDDRVHCNDDMCLSSAANSAWTIIILPGTLPISTWPMPHSMLCKPSLKWKTPHAEPPGEMGSIRAAQEVCVAFSLRAVQDTLWRLLRQLEFPDKLCQNSNIAPNLPYVTVDISWPIPPSRPKQYRMWHYKGKSMWSNPLGGAFTIQKRISHFSLGQLPKPLGSVMELSIQSFQEPIIAESVLLGCMDCEDFGNTSSTAHLPLKNFSFQRCAQAHLVLNQEWMRMHSAVLQSSS